MNVLFVSGDASGGDLAYRLKQEGHDVKMFIKEKKQRVCMGGMVPKTDHWLYELSWVGKDGLIVFDSTDYGEAQDRLRKKGYSVVGGSKLGDRLENERGFGQKVLAKHGINILPSHSFSSIDDAIGFICRNRDEWVIKQNGHASKTFNYVGHLKDGSDVIEMLKLYKKRAFHDMKNIELQKRVRGVEIGVGRYFNGNDWVGPIEMNIEHKSLYDGGLGPKTYEMGTLMWYDDNEKSNVLFSKTLAKLKEYLRKIDFRGDMEINCIVNEEGIHPLELTARFGFPATQLQGSLHLSPWGEFLKAVADGKPYELKYQKGFGIVVLVAAPPFPYEAVKRKYALKDMEILFSEELTEDEKRRLHFEEVKWDGEYFLLATDTGFVMHVSGTGNSVEEARQSTYSLANKIVFPKKFYRIDIGRKFIEQESGLLKKWGYLPKEFNC